jgi:hypothetical protein
MRPGIKLPAPAWTPESEPDAPTDPRAYRPMPALDEADEMAPEEVADMLARHLDRLGEKRAASMVRRYFDD